MWLNILAFLNFVALAATGAIMRWVLPPGSGGRYAQGGGGMGRGWRGGRGALESAGSEESPIRTLWGWGRHDWGDLHFWLAAALIAIIALHLVLHWSWIRCNILPTWLGGKPRIGKVQD